MTAIDKANGKTDITEPALPWGFDMFSLDREYGMTEPVGTSSNWPGRGARAPSRSQIRGLRNHPC